MNRAIFGGLDIKDGLINQVFDIGNNTYELKNNTLDESIIILSKALYKGLKEGHIDTEYMGFRISQLIARYNARSEDNHG